MTGLTWLVEGRKNIRTPIYFLMTAKLSMPLQLSEQYNTPPSISSKLNEGPLAVY